MHSTCIIALPLLAIYGTSVGRVISNHDLRGELPLVNDLMILCLKIRSQYNMGKVIKCLKYLYLAVINNIRLLNANSIKYDLTIFKIRFKCKEKLD